MARKHTTKDAPPPPPPAGASGGKRFLRYCFVLGLTGVVVLAWVSMLTYSQSDPPSSSIYPPRSPADNSAGIVGAYLAHMLRYWLGGGAYMGLLFASVAAFVMMFGGRVTDLPWRIIGLVLMVTSTSAAVYVAGNSSPYYVMDGSAGILGVGVGHLVLSWFGTIGQWVVIISSFCVGLMLGADNLMLKLPHLGKKAWTRRGDLPAMIGALGLHNRAAVAESGAVTASPRPAVAVPASMGAALRTPPSQSRRPAPPAAPPLPPALPTPAEPAPRPEKDTGGKYNLPPADLLANPTGGYTESQEAHAAEKRDILQQTLNDFNVAAEVVGHMTGPVITLFELSVAPGVKVAQISSLATDIARALAVPGVRVVSPIPGKDTVGIEVPNMNKEIVRLKELMMMAPDADKRMHIPLYLGKDAGGGAIVADLATMPHLLIAGTTGSGKSVCINSIIMAVLMTRLPEEVRLILADPKMVEMAAFENIPHLLCPIITDMRKAEDILEWAVGKMDERYELLKDANVKNIAAFNRLGADELCKRLDIETDEERARLPMHMPHYVIIIDELADLIMTSSKEVEGHIIRIAQKARAVGIHLILATQRPSVNVVTGLIKSNMPCRISFRVASRQESRIVLDQNGADVLLGQGDMLFLQPGDSNLIRAQGTYVDDSEIHSVVQTLHGSAGDPLFNSELMQINSPTPGEGGGDRDELFNQGVDIVLATQRGSVSLLQRRLQVGYSRASRIIDQMADAGILGDYKGSQARECLITLEDWQALQESIRRDQSGDAAIDGEPTSA